MEISPGIHTIVRPHNPKLQLPYTFQRYFPPKLNYPLNHSLSSLHPTFPRKWRQQLNVTFALPDETTSPGNLATELGDADPNVIPDASLALKKKATDLCADLKGTSIFLVGMNNTLKTKVGKIIADALRYYHFDSDSIVEEAAGEDSSGKSFRERDTDGFRESETEVLKQLSSMGRLVVNAGNGAVKSATNLALLRHGISIWLDVPLDMIAKEFISDEQSAMSDISTPDIFSEALARLTQIYKENKEGYATADVTISLQRVASKCAYDELEQVTAEDMTLEILKEIEKLTRVKKMMEEAGRPF